MEMDTSIRNRIPQYERHAMARTNAPSTHLARVHAVAIGVATLGAVALGAAGGPINPPAGPVTPSFKTLTDVEPRTAITAANTPGDAVTHFRITKSGSYYLTDNITLASGQRGITVDGVRATIDLNGFTISGPGAIGIYNSAATAAIIVRGGQIDGVVGTAVDVQSELTIEDVHISGVSVGISSGATRATIRKCEIENFSWLGISISGNGSVIEDTVVDAQGKLNLNGGIYTYTDGLVVRRCTVLNVGGASGSGVNCPAATSTVVEDCVIKGWYMGVRPGASATVRDCVITSADQYGIFFDNAAGGSLVERNRISLSATGVWCGSTAALGKTTVIRNAFTKVTTTIGNPGAADAGPLQSAAAATSPTANISN